MEGEKLHKESKRVIAAVKKAGTPYFTSPVNVGKFDTFQTIAAEVATAPECKDTFVMLCAVLEEQRRLYVATIVPADKNDQLSSKWIVDSTATLDVIPNFAGPSVFVRLGDLEFSADSKDTPFKAIDQVFATGSAWLRSKGLVVEEEEEHEYGWDDIAE